MNLLSMEDEAVVIGKTVSGDVAFVGLILTMQSFSERLTGRILIMIISSVCIQHEHFLHVINNFLVVRTIEDLSYFIRTSKKESLAYCRSGNARKVHSPVY